MSAAISIKIDNLKQVRSLFKTAPFRMTKEIGRAVNKTILKIENTAKREAPTNKQSGGGNLKQSIKSRMTRIASGVVEVGAGYGVYVHEGTRPHVIRVIKKKVLANRRTGDVFGRVVKHPGTRANPFLKRAVEKEQATVNKYFDQAITNVLTGK